MLGLTVGVPGLVDAAGAVPLATALGWRDVPVAADLQAALRSRPSPSASTASPTSPPWPSSGTVRTPARPTWCT
ncbi:hypothetical protein [Micromonospora tarapacensis]|uniref:hypothetical protein n=1 Tax=Micromonospora tarapacensis TaxID=2835305 RepID=UPI001E592334|nr:hypothetical protein [Micromonospora tarapacensis]